MADRSSSLDWKKEAKRALIFAALGAALFLIASFFVTSTYTVRVSLLPQNEESRSLLGQLSGLTDLPLDGPSSPEELFGEILRSERLLSRAIDRPWSFRGEEGLSLYEIYGVDEASPASREDLLDTLRRRISFRRDPRNGYMEIGLRAPKDPDFAAALAAFLVEELEAINLEYRQGRASEQRAFIEGRESEIRAELALAEEALADFMRKNRLYAQSPTLLTEYRRLFREVETLGTVWTELRGRLEMARIEEADRKPAISLLDAARSPARRSSPRFLLNIFLGIVFGLVLAGARLLVIGARPASRA